MKLQIKKIKTNAKAITIVSGFLCIINAIILIFTKTIIPGLGPISLGAFLIGMGILELINYEHTKSKDSQILGWTYVILFAINIYIGILQLDKFIN